LNRDQVQAVMAHCIASIGNGDLRLMQSLLATFQTLGLFHTFLDLPFRWSAWQALGAFARAMIDPHASPTSVQQAAHRIEESFSPESMAPLSVLIVPLLPFRLVTMFQRFILMIWCIAVLSWPLALLWRARRYLADSTAVQLTRNPNALASALSQIAAHAGIPAGGESRDYLFMCGTGIKRGSFDRYGVTVAMHPRLENRLKRLYAMGASAPRNQADAPSRLRMAVGWVIFGTLVSPLLVLLVLCVLAGISAIFWISLLTVFISVLFGLGFLSWAFGNEHGTTNSGLGCR
jgi:Zn-dependent protease with chaperone function